MFYSFWCTSLASLLLNFFQTNFFSLILYRKKLFSSFTEVQLESVFLIIFGLSFVMYINTADFLFTDPTTFISLLFCLNNSFGHAFRFSIHKIILSMDRDSFTSFFPTWMPLVSFPWLIVLPRTSSTMSNISDDTRHPCIIHYFRRRAFSLLSLNMMSSVGFQRCPFRGWGNFLPFLAYWVFYHGGPLHFVKCFFCIFWDNHAFLLLMLSVWYSTLVNFTILNQLYILGISPI